MIDICIIEVINRRQVVDVGTLLILGPCAGRGELPFGVGVLFWLYVPFGSIEFIWGFVLTAIFSEVTM